jgi:prepilin-type N-terminal cleavage/methylation domain-containing protein
MYRNPPSPVILGRASERGMTLLEILVVLAILAVVMGLLFGSAIQKALFESKEKTTALMVMELAQKGYTQWTLKTNEVCPESLAPLAKYTNAFENETKIQDAWNHDLIMICGDSSGELPEGVQFGVLSLGPDGKRDTADDIRSWKTPGKKSE